MAKSLSALEPKITSLEPSTTKSGWVKTMKLVYRSGSVHCNPSTGGSYWGCKNRFFYKDKLMTIITDDNKNAILLPAGKLEGLKPGVHSCGTKQHFYWTWWEQAWFTRARFSQPFQSVLRVTQSRDEDMVRTGLGRLLRKREQGKNLCWCARLVWVRTKLVGDSSLSDVHNNNRDRIKRYLIICSYYYQTCVTEERRIYLLSYKIGCLCFRFISGFRWKKLRSTVKHKVFRKTVNNTGASPLPMNWFLCFCFLCLV